MRQEASSKIALASGSMLYYNSYMTQQKPIILVGLMGAGKTSIGRKLAKALKLPFKDSDSMIEQQERCIIPRIFETSGEEGFRLLEYTMIERLLQEGPAVISTGGGAFIQENTKQLILEHGTAVWLDAALPVLIARVSKKNNRPLLQKGDKADIMHALAEARNPHYAKAHLRVDSGSGPITDVVQEIVKELSDYEAAA